MRDILGLENVQFGLGCVPLVPSVEGNPKRGLLNWKENNDDEPQ